MLTADTAVVFGYTCEMMKDVLDVSTVEFREGGMTPYRRSFEVHARHAGGQANSKVGAERGRLARTLPF